MRYLALLFVFTCSFLNAGSTATRAPGRNVDRSGAYFQGDSSSVYSSCRGYPWYGSRYGYSNGRRGSGFKFSYGSRYYDCPGYYYDGRSYYYYDTPGYYDRRGRYHHTNSGRKYRKH